MTIIIFVLLTAILPVIWLLWIIYRKDIVHPEPTKWLMKAFAYGVLSVYLSFVISIPMSLMLNIDIDRQVYSSIQEAITGSFLLVAIPEELSKFFVLWLLLRKNPFFDEYFDGIIYAVCVGLGFAALENVFYLLTGIEDWSWISIGVIRAFISVPAHYFFAILMGYYYSIYHFGIDRSMKTKVMILAAPIIAHGVFDSILFCMQINEAMSGLLVILLVVFFDKMRKRANIRINELVNK